MIIFSKSIFKENHYLKIFFFFSFAKLFIPALFQLLQIQSKNLILISLTIEIYLFAKLSPIWGFILHSEYQKVKNSYSVCFCSSQFFSGLDDNIKLKFGVILILISPHIYPWSYNYRKILPINLEGSRSRNLKKKFYC